MHRGIFFLGIVLWVLASPVSERQEPDLDYKPIPAAPACEFGNGHRMAIDEAHRNFHTADGRYRPFTHGSKRADRSL
jgi:hypothetical protein